MRCGTARTGGQPAPGRSAHCRRSWPVCPSRSAGWGGVKRRASRTDHGVLRPRGWRGSDHRGVSSRGDSQRSKAPWPAHDPHRSRGGSKRALGVGSPEQVHQTLPLWGQRTTKGVSQVLRVGLYATFAHAGSEPCSRCGFALGRTERQLRKSCRSQARTKFRVNRMRRNSGFCARNSRSRGVLMLSDGYRSR